MDGRIAALEEQLRDVVFGQEEAIHQVLVALLAGGHVLLEGVPGLGKTRLAKSLAHFVSSDYRRIQFTPDLMPSDIVGNVIFDVKGSEFQVHQGPVFANILLADEINRTPPKTQAALLEAMEEGQVSIYGATHELPNPFFVIATQNPIEYEGTYPLPEAQLDRFLMMVRLSYPEPSAERRMLKEHKIGFADYIARASAVLDVNELRDHRRRVQQMTAADEVLDYIVQLTRASRSLEGVMLGASPRAGTALLDAAKAVAYTDNRDYVIPDDVLEIAAPVLRHRLILDPNAEVEGLSADDFVARMVENVAAPR
ncbi:MoxR family ATPase [Alicyclobacillus sp. SO9]|uniref:AAA family ATPase n=1 Tax=Alicyclobacillus sp. SO9 TaxID=2665646 RepID=UPI001E33C10B|nr:MoxR family ATPase [Alicyclobacillus sp. SO9]